MYVAAISFTYTWKVTCVQEMSPETTIQEFAMRVAKI